MICRDVFGLYGRLGWAGERKECYRLMHPLSKISRFATGVCVCVQPCDTANDTTMICRTPDLRSASALQNMSTLAVLHYGFIMDDVQSVLDMSSQLPAGYFLDVFPDPQFDAFVNGIKQMFQPRNDYLTINV